MSNPRVSHDDTVITWVINTVPCVGRSMRGNSSGPILDLSSSFRPAQIQGVTLTNFEVHMDSIDDEGLG
jgi:hypothetical protein